MSRDVTGLSLSELARSIRGGEVSAEDAVGGYLARIESMNGQLHSYITVAGERAMAEARTVDADRAAGRPLGPLAGVPIGVKDSIATEGILTTQNSRVFEDWVPDEDSPSVVRLRAAGAIVIGKTNLNELGWAVPSEGDLNPPPHNPWNPSYLSIGSSSGSGSAMAARLCAGALGTDGGGSTRLPAGQHNLVGIKATHGRMSRSDISEICPMAHSVEDAARMLTAMCTPAPGEQVDARDAAPVDYAENLDVDTARWRIGVPRRFVDTAPLEPDMRELWEEWLDKLVELGFEVVDVRIRGLAEARAALFIVLNANGFARGYKTLRASREKYGDVARVYAMQGAFLSATDLVNARTMGDRVSGLVEELFEREKLRALTMPVTSFFTAEAARRPEEHARGVNAAFTAPFNLTGHPAISVPAGFGELGIPGGMQLVGRLFDEMSLLQIARVYEDATEWSSRRPVV